MKNPRGAKGKGTAVLMSAPVPEAEADRRLRPVLDALYKHNSKQAFKLANQALQKRPGWPAARALRGCVFLQTEKWEEAEAEVLAIRADLELGRVPIDEDAAEKLHMFYQETRQEQLGGEVYEQAWQTDIANFRLAEMAYGFYIRGYAFSAARKIATKLHRFASAKTQKYGLWASTAQWLELTCTHPEKYKANIAPDGRMLKLVCAMVSKAIGASSAPSAESVRLASRIYAAAEDYESARNLISHPRLVMDGAEMLHLRANASISTDLESACEDYRVLLRKHDPDDWAHWLQYFRCMGGTENWRKEAMKFVDESISHDLETKAAKRGPFLARMELLHRENDKDGLVQAIVQYFSKFGSKTTCAHDIRPYLVKLRDTEKFNNASEALKCASEGKGHEYHITLCWLQLWNGLLYESPDNLFSRYHALVSGEVEPTDRQAGDDYVLLAVHRLLPARESASCDRYADSTAVARGIVMLEAGLTQSPFNFHFKLLLILLYTELGALDRVAELWESLEVKHVQIATLSHLVLTPFFETGHHESLRLVLDCVDSLWSECDREIPECISKALQAGSLNAAVEFVNFRVRLENSTVLAEAMNTEILFELVAAGGDALGTQRALSTLRVRPRFTAESISSGRKLIANDDIASLQFWDLGSYDPELRLVDSGDEAAERGIPLSGAQLAEISGSLLSLESLLTSEDTRIKIRDTNALNKDVEVELSQHVAIRMRIAKNLNDVRHLLLRNRTTQSLSENDNAQESTLSASDVVQDAKVVGNDIHIGAESFIQSSAQAEDKSTVIGNLPKRLRSCGRFVFDTLMVSSVAITSFSQDLVRGRRRMKKSATKTGESSLAANEDFECARNSILLYRDAVLSACSAIEQWIANELGKESEWPDFLFGSNKDIDETFRWLPEKLKAVDLSEGRAQGSDLSKIEFVQQVAGHIRVGHSTTCESILVTLAAITQKLKLAEF